MPTITEGGLDFIFPNAWLISKFDDWSFYRNQFQSVCGGVKAVDVVAVEPRVCFWNIDCLGTCPDERGCLDSTMKVNPCQ